MGVREHALLPAALHTAARRASDALPRRRSGRPGGGGTLAVLRSMERRTFRRRRRDPSRTLSVWLKWAECRQRGYRISLRARPQVRVARRTGFRPQPGNQCGLHPGGQFLVPALMRRSTMRLRMPTSLFQRRQQSCVSACLVNWGTAMGRDSLAATGRRVRKDEMPAHNPNLSSSEGGIHVVSFDCCDSHIA